MALVEIREDNVDDFVKNHRARNMFLLVLLFLYILYKWLNLKPKNFPPGPTTVPLLGSSPFINTDNFHLHLEEMREIYGPVIGLKFGHMNAVAICGSHQVLEALKRDDLAARPSISRGEGVMFSNGQHWKDQRRFTLRHLRDFGFGKSSVSDMILDEVNEFCEKKLAGRKTVDVSGLFSTSSINILWAMMAGSRLSYDDQDFQILNKQLTQLFRNGRVNNIVEITPLLKKFISNFYETERDSTNRVLDAFFKKTINEHRQTKTETPRDFLDVYLNELENANHKPSFSETTLIEVCRDIFSAGSESSSNTISFAVLYLLLHPDWQEKIVREIDDNLRGRAPTHEDRFNLPLVEAFLSEVQRCNTIAPLTVPHSVLQDTDFNGYCIPKGAFVVVSIWALLQDKLHWGDPERFRPERFLNNEGGFVKDPYLLLFGAGPRFCLGEPLARDFVFLFFVSLLQRFKFHQPADTPLPSTVCAAGFTTAPQPFIAQLEDRAINQKQ